MTLLQDFEHVKRNLKTSSKKQVEALHKFLFEAVGDRNNRKRLREFSGFADASDEYYRQKCEYVAENLTNADITSICILLGLDYNVDDLMQYVFSNLRHDTLLKDVNQNDDEEQDEDKDDDDDEDDNNSNVVVEDITRYDDARSISSSNQQQPRVYDEQYRVQQRFSLNFRDVEDSVRCFDGSGKVAVEVWVQEFEEMSVLMGWDPLQKVIFAKKSIKGLAKLFIMGEKGLTTWKKLSDALLDEFRPKLNSAQIHKMLIERKMKPNEGVQEYFYNMKEIASRGDIDENSLIQYIVDGIRDNHANKVMLYGANNMKAFKDKLHTYEIFTKRQVTYGEVTNNKQRNFKDERSKEKITVLNNKKDDTKHDMKCYNCGIMGHVSSRCPNKTKGTKCFNCNKFGHVARNCKSENENKTSDVQLMTINKTKSTTKKDLVRKEVQIANKNIIILFDTGCKVNVMKLKTYENLKALGQMTISDIILRGFGSQENKIIPLGKINVNVQVDEDTFNLEFHVIPNNCMDDEAVIGYPICEQALVIIDNNGVQIKKRLEMEMMHICLEAKDEDEIDIEPTASKISKQKIQELVKNYNPTGKKTTNVNMKIILNDETPISCGPRRLPLSERYIVDEQVNKWLDENVIENSDSELSSPVVLVSKKDGSKRLCVDYRRLNKKIVKDRFPLPLIEDQLDRLQDAVIFSTIDLKNGFFHVKVDEASRKYTSFVTHNGQYQFLRVPFGLSNSPAVFQRHINAIFREMTHRGIALPYVDDIIIPAKTEEEAIQNLEEVFVQCQDYGLNINFKKSHFLKRKIEFVGYVIENQTISPSQVKKKAMIKYPIPKTMKQLESFLGLAGYFRKFIPDFAHIAKPLSDLKKKNNVFVMGEEQINSINILKNKLCESPVLKIFNEQHETELHTDASADGYGAVLMQKSPDDGKIHPVYYMSKKTTDLERKYISYELEILAVVEALKKFRVYLLGIEFKIVTDCNAFVKTMDKKDLSTRVSRWLMLLQEYKYTIEHRSGTSMRHVDALSRYPVMMLEVENVLSKMARAQKNDEVLKPILEILRHDDHYNDYFLKSNVLYKVVNGSELLVVPKMMECEIIKKAHEKGHFSGSKTKNLIINDYYIPKLDEKIQMYINNCVHCILVNRKRGKQDGELHPIPKQEIPLHTYHIDHLGPLESTSKMYKHIFVIIDAFTKFCWLYPTKSTTTKEVLCKLQLQSATFGNPKIIISDRGSAFTSDDFRVYCEEEGIVHHTVTTGLPRANGQVERLNSTIIAVLSKLSVEDPTKWYKYVAKVQQIINSTHHRCTNATPFEVLIGCKMRCPEDIKIKELIEEEMVVAYDEMRQQLRQDASDQIKRVQEENKHNYNLRRKPAPTYKVGDTVAIKRTQFGGGLKLKPKYLGPYVIEAVKPKDTYDVVKVGNHEGPNKTTTCAEYMKAWSDQRTFGAKE